jgi:hypothetical protein
MPRGNGMGPNGMGPMSGRAAGYCAGYGTPGFLNPAQGRGGAGGAWMGFFGRGRGRRNMFYANGLTGWQRSGAALGPEQELALLRNQEKSTEEGLQQARERIAELEKQGQG